MPLGGNPVATIPLINASKSSVKLIWLNELTGSLLVIVNVIVVVSLGATGPAIDLLNWSRDSNSKSSVASSPTTANPFISPETELVEQESTVP